MLPTSIAHHIRPRRWCAVERENRSRPSRLHWQRFWQLSSPFYSAWGRRWGRGRKQAGATGRQRQLELELTAVSVVSLAPPAPTRVALRRTPRSLPVRESSPSCQHDHEIIDGPPRKQRKHRRLRKKRKHVRHSRGRGRSHKQWGCRLGSVPGSRPRHHHHLHPNHTRGRVEQKLGSRFG